MCSHKSLLIENLLLITKPATSEQVEIAIQINHEYIHPYRSVFQYQPRIQQNENILVNSLAYIVVSALFLILYDIT